MRFYDHYFKHAPSGVEVVLRTDDGGRTPCAAKNTAFLALELYKLEHPEIPQDNAWVLALQRWVQ